MAAHLLTIPLELRLKICSLVIVNYIDIEVPFYSNGYHRAEYLRDINFERWIKPQIGEVRWSLALLLVNKQMKADVEKLVLKGNWIHFKGWIFERPRSLFSATKRRRTVDRFFDSIASLNNVYRVTRISLPMVVLPALLRWYRGEHRNLCSFSEILFYDNGYDREQIAAAGKTMRAAVLAKAEKLALLGTRGGFLPNELGVELHFVFYISKTEVRLSS